MSSSGQPQAIMTSPVFRYAVLVVLSVVVIMGAGVCYRTRVYQQRMYQLGGGALPRHAPSPTHDWGPKPTLFDLYLRAPPEKPPAEWDAIMPISVARGVLDTSGASSLARVSVMISMPFPEPRAFEIQEEPPGDDERYLPHLELGQSDAPVLLHEKALRSSAESDAEAAASNKKGS